MVDLTKGPVVIPGVLDTTMPACDSLGSISVPGGGLEAQPLSIVITHEQNKILRVPNRDMSLRQQQSLHTMLTGIALDPDSFARQVRKRRISHLGESSDGGSCEVVVAAATAAAAAAAAAGEHEHEHEHEHKVEEDASAQSGGSNTWNSSVGSSVVSSSRSSSIRGGRGGGAPRAGEEAAGRHSDSIGADLHAAAAAMVEARHDGASDGDCCRLARAVGGEAGWRGGDDTASSASSSSSSPSSSSSSPS